MDTTMKAINRKMFDTNGGRLKAAGHSMNMDAIKSRSSHKGVFSIV
ncbi:MAG: hypothetical protein NC831_06355 [Candidatus Omnitrophica bacterium]|nr:hypothetical protein [Candidatus Omnitrophota bacterium]MCM8829336.1 hypothetical protein [Candidatus Omnitrophota bacterium]